MTRGRPVIGWREWVHLPDLGGIVVKAKVDTGARTSALHAFDITQDGGDVHFTLHPVQRVARPEVRCTARLVDRRAVRSSSGSAQQRLVIATRIGLLGQVFSIELTLARRDSMGFRMLLGRAAMRGRFLVDPSRSYLAGKPQKGTR